MSSKQQALIFILVCLCLNLAGLQAATAEQSPVDVWETFLKPKYFPDQELLEDAAVIELKTPYRAEDAAVTPVSISAKLPQTESSYIREIYVFVDENPEPLVGRFHMTPAMGRADLAMRIRIDKYTNVRAIAVMNSGEHYMVTNFVKAQGGCSAPLGSDFARALENMGKMRFRTLGDLNDDDTVVAQIMFSHPNVTGMQKDQRTQLIRPAHFVKSVKVSFNGEHIMTAETGISVSEDPSFRFFFKPAEGGEMTAEVVDSKGMAWTHRFNVEPTSS